MNKIIKQLMDHMLADLETAMSDQEHDILKAIHKLKDNQEEDKPLVFSCSLGGKLNLDKNTVETVFAFSVKSQVKDTHKLEDPDQGKLAL